MTRDKLSFRLAFPARCWLEGRVNPGARTSIGDTLDPRLRRAKPRRKLFLPSAMRIGTQAFRVHLLDLSETGAQVHHPAPPPIGTTVLLDCGSERRFARVVRRDGARFGVQFTVPLSDAQVEAAVSRP